MHLKGRTRFIRTCFKYWLPVIFWMCFIFWMSTGTFSSQNTYSVAETILRFLIPDVSPQNVDLIHVFIRKAGHVIEYFVLGLLLFRAFRGDSIAPVRWRWPLSAAGVLVFWAASDEFHQSFVSTRTASIRDVGIDAVGGIIAQLACAFWHRYIRR